MKYFYLVLIYFLFCSSFINETKNTNSFIDIKVYYGMFKTVKIFEDGMIFTKCDFKTPRIVKFYGIKDLNRHNFYKLQSFLENNDFLNLDSIYYDSNKQYSGANYLIYVSQYPKFNKIIWESGGFEKLDSLLVIINNIVPKEDREIFQLYKKYK